MSVDQLACTYACLLLHDDGITVTAEKIATVVKAAKVNVAAYWPSLFAKLCEKKNIDDLIVNIGAAGAGGGPGVVAAPVAAAAAPPAEEKKEEPKEEEEESDDGGIMSLFD